MMSVSSAYRGDRYNRIRPLKSWTADNSPDFLCILVETLVVRKQEPIPLRHENDRLHTFNVYKNCNNYDTELYTFFGSSYRVGGKTSEEVPSVTLTHN